MALSQDAQVRLKQSLSDYKKRVEAFLQNRLNSLETNDEKLLKAMQHGLLQGGKRMRPYLVYTTGSLVDSCESDLDAPAAAIECIHSYSLIHDDLPAMDDDDLRRGLPTVHKAFDEATAILAGDSLQSLAYEILTSHSYEQTTPTSVLAMVKLLSTDAGYSGMCGGQALDLSYTDKAVDLSSLERMHRLKTGALIKTAILMGSYTSDKFTPQDRQHLSAFAAAIGLAFQVQDDILDVVGDTQTLGKPKGSDLEANKSTYVSLLGLDQARQKAQQLYNDSLEALGKLPYNTELLQAFAHFVVQRNH